jgi:hypothetical protein
MQDLVNEVLDRESALYLSAMRERNVYRTLAFELYLALAAVMDMPDADGTQKTAAERREAKRMARHMLNKVRTNHINHEGE